MPAVCVPVVALDASRRAGIRGRKQNESFSGRLYRSAAVEPHVNVERRLLAVATTASTSFRYVAPKAVHFWQIPENQARGSKQRRHTGRSPRVNQNLSNGGCNKQPRN